MLLSAIPQISQIHSANSNFRGGSRPKISVIMPIYNQEKYLEKAILSCENQTLKDIEIICVNDGSTDNSYRILTDYAKKDKRIKIINQSNQGTGRARNNGLKIAIGEYVAFLDPDDYIEPNAFEGLYNKAKKQNLDMLVFNFKKLNEQGEVITNYNLGNKFLSVYGVNSEKSFKWQDIKPDVFTGTYPASWNKIYRNDFVKNSKLHFLNSTLGEDNVFVYGAILNADKIGYCDEYYYNYVMHKNSAINTRSDKNLCIFRAIDSVKELIRKMGLTNELKEEFDKYLFNMLSFVKKRVVSIPKFMNMCKQKLSESQYKMIENAHNANSMLLGLVDSLKEHKQYGKLKIKPI